MNLYMSPYPDGFSENLDATRMLERSKNAYESAVRLTKMALFAGCDGKPVPEEIEQLHGDGARSLCARYYEAGAAIRRRTTQPPFKASLRSAPTHEQT